jgi:hypothetical protein
MRLGAQPAALSSAGRSSLSNRAPGAGTGLRVMSSRHCARHVRSVLQQLAQQAYSSPCAGCTSGECPRVLGSRPTLSATQLPLTFPDDRAAWRLADANALPLVIALDACEPSGATGPLEVAGASVRADAFALPHEERVVAVPLSVMVQ